MTELSAKPPQVVAAVLSGATLADLLDLAYAQLELLLQDPKTPPSVRMKAIQYIIEKATTAAAPPKAEVPVAETRGDSRVSSPPNSTQPPTPKPVQPLRRDHPKIGRNTPCPCGSHKKYKQCCLNLHNSAQPPQPQSAP